VETITSISPWNGEKITTIQGTSKDNIDQNLSNLRAYQEEWVENPQKRIQALQNIKEAFQNNQKRLATQIKNEAGYYKEDILPPLNDVVQGIEEQIKTFKQQRKVNHDTFSSNMPNTNAETRFVPIGVVGIIGAWNYPVWQTMTHVVPALLTGNTVVFKPSEHAPKTGRALSNLLKDNLPRHAFKLVQGGPTTGREIVNHDAVDVITYTGNPKTGTEISRDIPVTKTILELSGNDPAIITDNPPEAVAKDITYGAYSRSGEVCIGIKCCYIHAQQYNDVKQDLIMATKQYDTSPLISKKQRTRLHRQVQQLKDNGANVLVGGKPTNSYSHYPATLIECKPSNMPQEELFGPILPITKTRNNHSAVQQANNTTYGLGASIWTTEKQEQQSLAKQLDAGTIWINDSNIPLHLGNYFNGWKQSGLDQSTNSLRRYQRSKTVIKTN